MFAAVLGAAVFAGCEPAKKPSPPIAKAQEVSPKAIAENPPQGAKQIDSEDALQENTLLAEEESAQEILPPPHPDIFDGGDRSIVLGTEVWVTLSDGRQCRIVYSADGTLLMVDGAAFEMYSTTVIKIPFREPTKIPSQIKVKEVLIRSGATELAIKGSSKGVSGETVFSREALQKFVGSLSKGETPEFPLQSTLASSGFIKKHEQQKEDQ